MACGDDEPGNPDAPRVDSPLPIDAATDAPIDAADVIDYDDDEGGELRIEYIRFKNGGNGIRATSFFLKNPGATPYHPFVNLNGCTNTSAGNRENWPFKQEADRVYADAGTLTISNKTNGSSFQIAKSAGTGPDPFARTHVANSWYFKSPLSGSAPAGDGNLLPPKTRLSVTLGGSADMPTQSFDDVLYVPADFTVNDQSGTLDTVDTTADPQNLYEDFVLTANTALNVTFENSDDQEPTGYRVDSLVGFTGSLGPAVICAEPKDGSVTVPAAMVDVGRATYGSGGTFARQTLTHVVRELELESGPTGRRIDFVTVWCYATAFTVAASN